MATVSESLSLKHEERSVANESVKARRIGNRADILRSFVIFSLIPSARARFYNLRVRRYVIFMRIVDFSFFKRGYLLKFSIFDLFFRNYSTIIGQISLYSRHENVGGTVQAGFVGAL